MVLTWFIDYKSDYFILNLSVYIISTQIGFRLSLHFVIFSGCYCSFYVFTDISYIVMLSKKVKTILDYGHGARYVWTE